MSAHQYETKPIPTKLTAAAERVLKKAHANGRVFVAGGFGRDCDSTERQVGQLDIESEFSDEDHDEFAIRDDPNFDTHGMICRLLRQGLLRHGEYYNSYVLTDAGILALLERDLVRSRRRGLES